MLQKLIPEDTESLNQLIANLNGKQVTFLMNLVNGEQKQGHP